MFGLKDMMFFMFVCMLPINYFFHYTIIAYQPILLHRLIRINIKIRLITNNYNYLSHVLFHLLNSNTYYKIHIYDYLVSIYFILHHTSICVWYIFNWIICLLVFLKDRRGAVLKSPHLCQEVLGSKQPLCKLLQE